LRTETVICDTRDFGIGRRRVTSDNWRALRAVGEHANRRLCDAQAIDARPAPDMVTLQQVTRPSTTPDGLHAPSMRSGDPRVMAVLAALVGFCHLLVGFTNHQLTELVGALLDTGYGSRQATYDLRRLLRKGLIVRIPGTHRYLLTPLGRRMAVLFTKPTAASLLPGWPSWTRPCQPSWPGEHHWRLPGVASTRPWTPSSTTRCLLPELDLVVNFIPSKAT
jgi:hypothetical protein